MRGYHPEEINLLNDEELDNLIYTLNEERKFRKEQKIEELHNEFDDLLRLAKKEELLVYYEEFNGDVRLLESSRIRIEK